MTTKLTFLVLLVLFMVSAAACAPSGSPTAIPTATLSGPEAVARLAFEQWAQQNGVPYRDVRLQTLSNDSYFATVSITAWFRDSAQADWQEKEATVECKNVGGMWQTSPRMSFGLTRAQVQKTATSVAAAAATASAQRTAAAATATIQTMAATATAEAALLHVLRGQTRGISSVAFSPDGKTLASGSGDGSVKLWEVTSGREVRTFTGWSVASGTVSVAFSLDGKTLTAGNWQYGTVKFWDVISGQESRPLIQHGHYLYDLALSSDGKILATGGYGYALKLWDMASGKEMRTLWGRRDGVSALAFSPDGKMLAAGNSDNTFDTDKSIQVWEVATGREVYVLAGHSGNVTSVAFSHDSKMLASGSEEEVTLWNLTTGQEIRTITWGENYYHFLHGCTVAFSPDGKTLASGSNAVRLWDVNSGQEVQVFAGGPPVAYSPDGKILAAGGSDNTVVLWRVK